MNDVDLIDSINGEFEIIDNKNFKIKWLLQKDKKKFFIGF